MSFIPLNIYGWSSSIVTLGISLNLAAKIDDMKLSISKRAFFELREVYVDQIPDYQGLAFAFFTVFLVYKLYGSYQLKQKQMAAQDYESQYLLKLQILQDLEWGNLVMGFIFILLTLGLALILATWFASSALDEANRIINLYSHEPSISSSDLDVFDDLEGLFPQFRCVMALNIISLIILLAQFGFSLYQKRTLQKQLK